MALDPKSKAAAGIQALRDRLSKSSPGFAKASDAEARMEAFCASVRSDLQMRRRAKELNQEEVAGWLNLTQSAISKIEGGDGDIGLRTLYRYARAIGLRPIVTFTPEEEREVAEGSSPGVSRRHL
jgi:DNA-binding XRE family transcriptional regulator